MSQHDSYLDEMHAGHAMTHANERQKPSEVCLMRQPSKVHKRKREERIEFELSE